MPFILPALPAIIGAAGTIGASALAGGKGGAGGSAGKWQQNANGESIYVVHGKAYLPSGQPWTSDQSVANDKSQWISPPPMDDATAVQNKQDKLINSTTPFLESLYKDPSGGSDLTKTPLYNKLLTLGTDSTTEAYNHAKSTTLARANTAGFGYEQPIAQGAESGVEAEESRQLADVPTKAYKTAVDTGLQATAQQTGKAGVYQPLGFAKLESDQGQLDYQNKSALWQQLAKLGTSLIPKAGTPGQDESWG